MKVIAVSKINKTTTEETNYTEETYNSDKYIFTGVSSIVSVVVGGAEGYSFYDSNSAIIMTLSSALYCISVLPEKTT